MTFTDSIVALSSKGGGGISIIRISGNNALNIALNLTKKENLTPRYATLCSIYKQESNKSILIDEAIVIYYKAPHSYTKEDVIEIQCHGSNIIANQIINEVLKLGARIARNGEFTKRAFLNGRIDLAKVNAISKMLKTNDENFSNALARQLKGELGNFVESMRNDLLKALAYSEVMIDYSEEDIPQDTIENLKNQITNIESKLQEIYDFSKMRENLNDGINLCIAGKPNVGKSSILNALLLFDRAITSNIAGTTRDTIEEIISIDGISIKLIDTAGIRNSEDEIESIGIEKSKKAILKSNFVLLVLDSSRDLEQIDIEILKLIPKSANLIIALNKSDLESKLDLKSLEPLIKPLDSSVEILKVNALDSKATLQTLKTALSKKLESSKINENGVILSAAFQIDSAFKTLSNLKESKVFLETNELELFSFHINEALRNLGEITSPFLNEEVLDSMFSEFCLGK